MLEIGLGCNMGYGPGASAKLWRTLLPNAKLWMAEYDGKCVRKHEAKLEADGIRTLEGDQGSPDVVRRWVEESGGHFDVIVDDGGVPPYLFRLTPYF